MPKKRRVQEAPIRISPASKSTAKRIAEAIGAQHIQIVDWAVEALGHYFDHHRERLLLPLRFNETFFVYQAAPPLLELPPHQPKLIRATVVTDAEGLVLSIDPAFTDICGYTFEELRGRKPGDILQGPATEQEIVEQFREALREQAPFECTITNYHKNGTTYRVHIKCEPVFKGKNLSGFKAEERKLEPPTQ